MIPDYIKVDAQHIVMLCSTLFFCLIDSGRGNGQDPT